MSLLLRKIYKLYLPRLRYSVVWRLLGTMADNDTCIKTEEISANSPKTTENNGSLKRSLHDDIKKEEDTSSKRLKTEHSDEVFVDGCNSSILFCSLYKN